MQSPLCSASQPTIKRRIKLSRIVDGWKNIGHDVSAYFRGMDELLLLECPISRLQFFGPDCVEGDSSLYAFLGKQPWYYDPNKWEFLEVVKALVDAGHKSVLEVGCGNGEFLNVAKSGGVSAYGIDINSNAVTKAKEKGLLASTQTLRDVQQTGKTFDAVAAFQVLEHVRDPLDLLSDMTAVVRHGGSVFLAVPNADSWISRRLSLLDTPPHHYTRWTLAAFQFVTRVLPLDLEDVMYEPMSRDLLRAWALSLCDPDPEGADECTEVGRRAPFVRRLVARSTALVYGSLRMPPPAVGPSLLIRFRRR